ncbi:MAG: lysoplasmalogenase [Acutalibacteraceae bacterium]
MIYVPVILGAITLVAFMVKCNKKRSVGGVFLKNTVSMFFIITAVLGTYLNGEHWQYALTVITGLAFGMLGDIYLDQKWVYPPDDNKYLAAGFTCFGIGHIVYVAGMYIKAEFSPKDMIIPLITGLVVAVANLILEKPMKQDFGKFRPVLAIYGFVLALTLGTAVMAAVKTGQTAFIIYAVGAVFFLLSDLILSPMYFGVGKNTPFNFVINHLTYYIGQYMIALTIFFMK